MIGFTGRIICLDNKPLRCTTCEKKITKKKYSKDICNKTKAKSNHSFITKNKHLTVLENTQIVINIADTISSQAIWVKHIIFKTLEWWVRKLYRLLFHVIFGSISASSKLIFSVLYKMQLSFKWQSDPVKEFRKEFQVSFWNVK